MNINRIPTFDVPESFTEKTKKVIEFTKALEEDAQMQTEEAKAREVDRLNKLLPRALWMFLNNERRQEVFTSDHIRSLPLRFQPKLLCKNLPGGAYMCFF